MITIEQLKATQDRLADLKRYLNIEDKKIQLEEEELRTQVPGFWDDQKAAEKQMKVVKGIRFWIEAYNQIATEVEELSNAFEFYKEELVTEEEVDAQYKKTVDIFEDIELKNMLQGEEDHMNCVLKINAGAGGTEANDWAQQLQRLYMRYAEDHGYKINIQDLVEGDDAGIKSVTMEIEGDYAFGYLKSENGVHRLVRVSPYNAQGKRMTSFASVFAFPMIDDTIDVQIDPGKLTWDTFRSGGAGGQNVNKVESGVRARYMYTDPYTGEAHDVALASEQAWATHNTLLSYFGRLNYTLLDRYMLTATYRADGSSKFAKGNKWGYFPAVALAWKISEEPFMKKLHWMNELKLRLGWGKTGQQDLGMDFGYATLFTVSNTYAQYMFGNTPYQTIRINSYNPDLTWEKTTTWNAGLDFGFLSNRITASVDAYYRKTTDLLNTVVIPVGTNFASTLTKNMGSLKNYGVEFSVNAKPIVTKDFTWDVSYNVSWNHNEITELTGATDDDYYVKTGATISRGNSTQIMANKVGYAANSFFVYQQVYDENGHPIEGMYVDRNGDGKINESDRYLYKKPAADVIMGLTTKFIYKRFDLSASFHASLGNYVYYDFLSDKAAISASGLYSNSAFHNTTPEAVALGFTGEGSEYYLSDYFVRNASYLKCSNITLGYSFPALLKYNDNDYFSGRVFATVQNPFIITKYKGLDPEVSSGVDRNPYPRPISVQLGVNLNF